MEKLREIMDQISADAISKALQLVINRYQELFPGWDITMFAIEKCGDRTEQINNIIRLLEAAKEEG